jgi:serine/threonine protein phosphatase PrpC
MITSAFRTHIGGSDNIENQDSFLTAGRRFCIADGHGREGRRIAELACESLTASTMTPEAAFAAVDAALRPLYETSGSGTTASVLDIDEDGTCRISHVGDTEVRYFDTDDGDGVSLTADHSTICLDEFRRVNALNVGTQFIFDRSPRYSPRDIFVQGISGDWILNPRGGFSYCTVRNDWSGYLTSPIGDRLAMTRALGDFHMKPFGVSVVPSTSTLAPRTEGVRAIVMASDGLWDALQYSEVRAIVRDPACLGNASVACERLMALTMETGVRLFGASLDNVTVGVIYVPA